MHTESDEFFNTFLSRKSLISLGSRMPFRARNDVRCTWRVARPGTMVYRVQNRPGEAGVTNARTAPITQTVASPAPDPQGRSTMGAVVRVHPPDAVSRGCSWNPCVDRPGMVQNPLTNSRPQPASAWRRGLRHRWGRGHAGGLRHVQPASTTGSAGTQAVPCAARRAPALGSGCPELQPGRPWRGKAGLRAQCCLRRIRRHA